VRGAVRFLVDPERDALPRGRDALAPDRDELALERDAPERAFVERALAARARGRAPEEPLALLASAGAMAKLTSPSRVEIRPERWILRPAQRAF
jgi:hypothetical protein